MICNECNSYAYALNIYGEINGVICIPCNTFIPMVEGQADYQKFLDWVNAGNIPPKIYY